MESVLAMLSQSAWMYFTNRLGMVDYVPHGQAQGGGLRMLQQAGQGVLFWQLNQC